MRKKLLEGSVKRHPDGFGFFIPDQAGEPDVYIPRHNMTGVMGNDRVEIEVFPEPGGQRFRGEITQILNRAHTKIVGVFSPLNTKYGMIRDEGQIWGSDLRIPVNLSMGAQKGQLVSASILHYPNEKEGFQGEVSEIIGDSSDPLTDVKRVLISQSIPYEWPSAVIQEAKKFDEHVQPKDFADRKDLRDLNFVTIDGATAKDFDDAILIEQRNQGFLLYVAIADVSHYVRTNTAIDKEAYTRGTSVYFPHYVVPMLPEVLSNGLCSLNPNVDRLAMVAEIHMDFQGQVQKTDFYEGVIKSKARITYGEAQEIIDGNTPENFKHVAAEVRRAADLAKILMAKRFREGSLDLEIPETQIVLDSSGLVRDMVRSERLFAHRVIEEMMLSANVAVAKFINEREAPALYRVHDSPNSDAIDLLERFIHNFGGPKSLGTGKLQKKLTQALHDFDGKPEAHILNILTLRSMSQAKYSPENIGHFGLGFTDYSHFTSPIRRYPDLIIHRQLKALVHPKKSYRLMGEEELQTAGVMLSACEQRAVKSERQFVAIKKARFMKQHLGKEFEGMISSVTKFGIFVLLRQFEVDGLCRIESLSKEKLIFDEERLCLFGKKTGQRFSIGDMVRIRVDKADPEAGQVDFAFVERIGEANGQNAKSSAGKGSRFDIDTHFDKAMQKWKERGGGKPAKHNNSKSNSKSKPSAKHSYLSRKEAPTTTATEENADKKEKISAPWHKNKKKSSSGDKGKSKSFSRNEKPNSFKKKPKHKRKGSKS